MVNALASNEPSDDAINSPPAPCDPESEGALHGPRESTCLLGRNNVLQTSRSGEGIKRKGQRERATPSPRQDQECRSDALREKCIPNLRGRRFGSCIRGVHPRQSDNGSSRIRRDVDPKSLCLPDVGRPQPCDKDWSHNEGF